MKAPILLGECILRVVNAFARRYGIALGTETYREVNTLAQGAAWEWLCQQFSEPDDSERWEAVVLSAEQGRAVMGFMWNKLRDWWRGEREWRRRVVPLAFWNGEAALESVLAMAEWEALAARLGLREEDKAIVRLLGEGYTQSEVAAHLGISQGRVGQRLARIRRLLGRYLGENSESSGGAP